MSRASMPDRARIHRWGWFALAVLILGTFWLAFLPLDTRVSDNFVPLSRKLPAIRCFLRGGCRWMLTSRAVLIDWVGNVLFFIPLGAALALIRWPGRAAAGWRWAGWVVLTGALISTGIELGQLLVPGRATDVDDVILNTIGVVVGLAATRASIAVVAAARRLMPP